MEILNDIFTWLLSSVVRTTVMIIFPIRSNKLLVPLVCGGQYSSKRWSAGVYEGSSRDEGLGDAREQPPVVQTPPLHSYTGGPGTRPHRPASVSRYVNLSWTLRILMIQFHLGFCLIGTLGSSCWWNSNS